jgi:anti-anti-sigma factor
MNERSDGKVPDAAYQCPDCGTVLPCRSGLFDEYCPQCRNLLWCYQRVQDSCVLLEAVAHRTPTVEDLDRLVEMLLKAGTIERVVLNLSAVDSVTTSLVARVVSLNRRICSAGGHLALCGMRPAVRDVFHRFRLDTILLIADSQEVAESST